MGIGVSAPDWPGSYDDSRSNDFPNPDPSNFRIRKTESVGRFLVVEVVYPDCTNFEGRKILVFENVSEEQIERARKIDPHFARNKKISPIARFTPTEQGWEYAISFCKSS